MKLFLTLVLFWNLNLVASEIKFQTLVSNKIKKLTLYNFEESDLNTYISEETRKCFKAAKGIKKYTNLCDHNEKLMIEINDLETIIDLNIAKLTEFQTSYIFTLFSAKRIGNKNRALFFVLLPITLILDSPIILLDELT